jgi:hypothetical protein
MTPEFPTPVRLNGRLYFVDRAIENHKRKLAGLPALPDDPTAPIKLRPASEVAADFGFGRRTLGRRVAQLSERTSGVADNGHAA